MKKNITVLIFIASWFFSCTNSIDNLGMKSQDGKNAEEKTNNKKRRYSESDLGNTTNSPDTLTTEFTVSKKIKKNTNEDINMVNEKPKKNIYYKKNIPKNSNLKFTNLQDIDYIQQSTNLKDLSYNISQIIYSFLHPVDIRNLSFVCRTLYKKYPLRHEIQINKNLKISELKAIDIKNIKKVLLHTPSNDDNYGEINIVDVASFLIDVNNNNLDYSLYMRMDGDYRTYSKLIDHIIDLKYKFRRVCLMTPIKIKCKYLIDFLQKINSLTNELKIFIELKDAYKRYYESPIGYKGDKLMKTLDSCVDLINEIEIEDVFIKPSYKDKFTSYRMDPKIGRDLLTENLYQVSRNVRDKQITYFYDVIFRSYRKNSDLAIEDYPYLNDENEDYINGINFHHMETISIVAEVNIQPGRTFLGWPFFQYLI